MPATKTVLEDFRGDFSRLAALMQRSWMENVQQPLFYTADFLASHFQYPGASFSLAPTLYDASGPLAFVAGFPRRIRVQGRDLRIVLGTFLTVAPEYKNRGVGFILWRELARRAQASGFDGALGFCVEGDAMNGMMLECGHTLGISIGRIYSIRHRSTLLHSSLAAELATDVAGSGDGPGWVETFMEIAAAIPKHTPLARIWSKEEATWQCVHRFRSVFAGSAKGSRKGILTAYVIPISNPQRTNCLLIEDVLWGNLEREERRVLLGHLLGLGVKAGAQMAILPILGYTDMEAFAAAHFLPSLRTLHAYLTVWSGQVSPGAMSSMYLDVV